MALAIRTRDLTKKFGDFTAVDRVTLEIEEGEVCGFLGPNGAGKSTTIRMLCGILDPTSGTGNILGYDLVRDTDKIKNKIGYMSQKFSLYHDLTVTENLEFYMGIYSIPPREKKSRREEVLEKIGLSREKNELVSTLSQGFRQRLALGCAIVSRPSLLFLDEPTSGVSPTSRRSFFNLIQEMAAAGTTVIVTTHFMDEAERCDKIAFFHEGQLLSAASPDDLKKNILEGTLVQMDLPDPMKQIPKIQDLPYVKECTIHGAFLHVLLTDPSAVNTLKTFTGVEPLAITPSLEDVFIALVRKQRGENQ